MTNLKNFPPELNLPDLQMFDKQMGQFTTPELFYAIPLPCILMEWGQFTWETVGKNQQRGTGNIRFYIYFENYADSFSGSVNSDLALRFFDFTEQVNMFLNGLSFPNMAPLQRIGDNEDNAQDMIITSTIDFGTEISDIASDETRNFVLVDPAITVTRLNKTNRPAGNTYTNGYIL